MHIGLIYIHVQVKVESDLNMGDIGVTITCLNVMYTCIVNVIFNVWQRATPLNRKKSKLKFKNNTSELYDVDCVMWESMEAKVISLATNIIKIKKLLLMNMGGIFIVSKRKMFTTTTMERSHTLPSSGINSLKVMALALVHGLANINFTPLFL
jgi:hypothetical protein